LAEYLLHLDADDGAYLRYLQFKNPAIGVTNPRLQRLHIDLMGTPQVDGIKSQTQGANSAARYQGGNQTKGLSKKFSEIDIIKGLGVSSSGKPYRHKRYPVPLQQHHKTSNRKVYHGVCGVCDRLVAHAEKLKNKQLVESNLHDRTLANAARFMQCETPRRKGVIPLLNRDIKRHDAEAVKVQNKMWM